MSALLILTYVALHVNTEHCDKANKLRALWSLWSILSLYILMYSICFPVCFKCEQNGWNLNDRNWNIKSQKHLHLQIYALRPRKQFQKVFHLNFEFDTVQYRICAGSSKQFRYTTKFELNLHNSHQQKWPNLDSCTNEATNYYSQHRFNQNNCPLIN